MAIKPEEIILSKSMKGYVLPFADTMVDADSVLSNKREKALEIGGKILDATARMTPDERKAHIEMFIIEVCTVLLDSGVIGESSVADRKCFMRAMIGAAGHADAILKATAYAVKSYPDIYQRSRQIERTARHVKSRLNKPSGITLAALKRWVDADAKSKAKTKAKARKAKKLGPLGKLNAALAFLTMEDADYGELLAADYVSDKMLEAAQALAKEITKARLAQDGEWEA